MGIPHRSSASTHSNTAGFSLVEVLVAIAVLSVGVMAVAQLSVLASRANVMSRDVSYATVLASQKLNELVASNIADLTLSAADAWMTTTGDSIEYLDSSGVMVAAGGAPPGDAIYVRRWSITPVAGDTTGGVVIQVSAGRIRRLASGMPADARPSDVARVVGIRSGTTP